jgi:multidrug efflux system membrane fusion protein
VQTARLNYEFTQIRAPIDGRIGRELVTPGNLISGDQTTLTTIVSIDPVYVYIDTDERAVLKYRRLAASGQRANETEGRIPAQLRLIDESGYPHEGYIDYVDPRMDPSTGTLRVRALINNPDQILSPGLFAHIRIHGSAPHPVVLIPERAIGTDQDQKFVWVIREDHAVEYRKVSLGRQSGSFRVINDGLHSGEEIVVDGLPKIRPGAHVQAERLDLPYDG